MIKIYNTLTRKIEEFKPINKKEVGFYACGPTVYNFAHIGNLRAYVCEDILRRTLKYNGYNIKHIINITDVGHLTDDADTGEDKIEKGAKKEGKTAYELAEFYSQAFKKNIEELNILEPTIWCKATDHIQEQIKQIQELINKGYTYETTDGIYFDTTKLRDYGKLAQLEKQQLEAGARVDLGEKKNLHDFALWKFSKEGEKRQMEWDAPFDSAQGKLGKKGFPGWHIECSAMSMKYLGDQFDIHCGGIDHIPIHHTNEIAQAEAVTGKKPWVNYWVHNEFLIINESKMSKSEENFITLETIKEKGVSPLSYRYLLLQTHYRKQLNFTWESLEAAQNGLNNIREHISKIKEDAPTDPIIEKNFFDSINNDLNTPEALAVLWSAIKSEQIGLNTIIEFDKILGLDLHNPENKIEISDEIQNILDKREKARKEKNWSESDVLRDKLEELGLKVEDTEDGQKLHKI
jgi:cysteinyl-tRNA synthetase